MVKPVFQFAQAGRQRVARLLHHSAQLMVELIEPCQQRRPGFCVLGKLALELYIEKTAQFREARGLSLVGQLAVALQLLGVLTGVQQHCGLQVNDVHEKHRRDQNYRAKQDQSERRLHISDPQVERGWCDDRAPVEYREPGNGHQDKEKKQGAGFHVELLSK